ncbi:hypothetical protein ATCC90586_011282 [Pythium insidiosum]|nr:hypothetical protein ATCC90586_011282 [Pythium insidiosum]
MKVLFKLLLLVALVSTAASTQALRQPTRELQRDTSALEQLTSAAAIKTGEQILEEVNKVVDIPKKVDSGRLMDVAAKIATGDAALQSADAETKKVVDALTQAVGKLFPGQQVKDALARLLLLLPKSA